MIRAYRHWRRRRALVRLLELLDKAIEQQDREQNEKEA